MNNNYIKIFLMLLLVFLISLKYLGKKSEVEIVDSQISSDEITNLKDVEISDENNESEKEIDSDEIEGMFNMEKFNEGTENDKKNDNNKEFVYLDIVWDDGPLKFKITWKVSFFLKTYWYIIIPTRPKIIPVKIILYFFSQARNNVSSKSKSLL